MLSFKIFQNFLPSFANPLLDRPPLWIGPREYSYPLKPTYKKIISLENAWIIGHSANPGKFHTLCLILKKDPEKCHTPYFQKTKKRDLTTKVSYPLRISRKIKYPLHFSRNIFAPLKKPSERVSGLENDKPILICGWPQKITTKQEVYGFLWVSVGSPNKVFKMWNRRRFL